MEGIGVLMPSAVYPVFATTAEREQGEELLVREQHNRRENRSSYGVEEIALEMRATGTGYDESWDERAGHVPTPEGRANSLLASTKGEKRVEADCGGVGASSTAYVMECLLSSTAK